MLLDTRPAAAQDLGRWREFAPLPTARQEVGVGLVDGRIYVVGGFDASARSVNTVERYDPPANQWQALSDLPSTFALNHAGVAAVGGRLYVIGGLRQNFQAVDSVFCFDPASGDWTEKASLPAARGAMGVTVIDGLIYAAGGLPTARGNDFAAYDPQADRWTPLAVIPTSRDHLAAAAVGGRFHAIGGRPNGVPLRDANEEYDPATNQWRPRASLPTARAGIAAAVFQLRIYVFGGEGNPFGSNGVFEEVEVYDPASNQWQTLEPLPVARHGIGAATFLGRIFIPGGGPIQGLSTTDRNDAFTPPLPPVNSLVDFILGRSNDPSGLDLNEDSMVNAADLVLRVVLQNQTVRREDHLPRLRRGPALPAASATTTCSAASAA